MIQDTLMGHGTWRDAWLWYRGASHQEEAINQLYAHILELPGGACLLAENAEWFQHYRSRSHLVRSFLHPEGE
jgi:hypothetical protein